MNILRLLFFFGRLSLCECYDYVMIGKMFEDKAVRYHGGVRGSNKSVVHKGVQGISGRSSQAAVTCLLTVGGTSRHPGGRSIVSVNEGLPTVNQQQPAKALLSCRSWMHTSPVHGKMACHSFIYGASTSICDVTTAPGHS